MKKLFPLIQTLALVGMLLALFLLWEKYATPAFQPCNINSVVNCNAIISGEVARTLGIPTPFIGLFGYLVIFIAAGWRRRKLLFGMATFGLLFCLYIGYRELFQLHVVCPVCIFCQLDMLTVFVLSGILLRKTTS